MNILLIQPKMNKRPMDTDLKSRMSPSLALLTLMRLTPETHTVTMVNENIESVDFQCDVGLVGITVTLDVMPRAIRIADAFRRRGIAVVAGGIHVTCSPEECLPHFSAICVGAAERVWEAMVRDAEAGALRRVYHDMQGFRGDEIASPLYGVADKNYLYTNVVTASRGCPNSCDFCYNSCQNSFYVQRPVADVVRDIRACGTRHILFIDDNFAGSPAHTRRLLCAIRGLGIKWNAAVTTAILNDLELLDLMAETGCQSLFIGFESINDSALRAVNKPNRFAQYERLIGEIHKRGMMINASMVFGLDGDDKTVFDNTLAWLEKHKIETLTSHILTPYPGTALYRRMEQAGRIVNRDLAKYNTAHVVFRPEGMTAEELYGGYRRMYRRFYSFRSIVRRLPVLKTQRAPYLLFSLFYRKFGKFTSALSRLVPLRLIGKLATRMAYKIK